MYGQDFSLNFNLDYQMSRLRECVRMGAAGAPPYVTVARYGVLGQFGPSNCSGFFKNGLGILISVIKAL